MNKRNEFDEIKNTINFIMRSLPNEFFTLEADKIGRTKDEQELYNKFKKISNKSGKQDVFECFHTLVKEKILNHVKIRMGHLNYCKSFFGCLVKEQPDGIDSKCLRKTIELISELNILAENAKNTEIWGFLSKSIREEQQKPKSATMVLIKLFSLYFPNYVLPIFKTEYYNKFLSIFSEEDCDYENWSDILDDGYRLIDVLNDFLTPYNMIHPYNYTKFLFYFAEFIEDLDLMYKLHSIGFYSYPLVEQTVVGIFYALLSNEKTKEVLKPLKEFQTIRLQEDYPDLVGKVGDKLIKIEFEYDLEKYNHKNENTVVDYVVCWDNISEKDISDLKHANNETPKGFICLKDVIKKNSI